MSVVRAALLAVGAGRAAGYGPRLATGRPVVAMNAKSQKAWVDVRGRSTSPTDDE